MPIRLIWKKKDEPKQPEVSESPTEEPKPSAPPKRKRRFLRIMTYWLTVLTIWGVVTFLGTLSYFALTLPDPVLAGKNKRPPNVTILSTDGSIIASRGMRREHIRIEHMPRHLVNAVLAIEDSRFYDHFGIDPYGLIRAGWTNYRTGQVVQGGSTITQQLAKNLYFSSKQSVSRKLKEAMAAIWMEIRLSKEEIIELYLNRVYFGAGAHGIEAAAYQYFGKTTGDLTLGESALLAGLLKAPSRYSPTQNPKTSRRRTQLVLKRMMDLDLVDKRLARKIIVNPVKLRRTAIDNDFSYVADWIIAHRLPGFLGYNEKDLVVETTIDKKLQAMVQHSLRNIITREGRRSRASEAAAVIYDASGGIKALSGGLSHKKSPYNRATKAKRQPGSAFKPFVFLAALESGLTPGSYVLDTPIDVDGWRPRNYAGFYRGRITIRQALRKSVNTAAVRLFLHAGRERVVRTARRLGISTEIHHEPSLALGTAEVNLLELTGAYVPFANGGKGILPHVIKRVRNISGKILYERQGQGPGQIIELVYVKAMNRMMNSVILRGTGRRAYFSGQALAGKTGTTQDYKDAWFVGYSPYYVMGVWVGNDDNTPMRAVTGGKLPAMIWRHVMTRAHKGLRPRGLHGVHRLY
ncbi:MAG: transglycosylase domain-containing protein [Methyloligellaceae bacterium]